MLHLLVEFPRKCGNQPVLTAPGTHTDVSHVRPHSDSPRLTMGAPLQAPAPFFRGQCGSVVQAWAQGLSTWVRAFTPPFSLGDLSHLTSLCLRFLICEMDDKNGHFYQDCEEPVR